MNTGLDAYFDWAHRKADRLRENLMLALLMVAMVGCAAVPQPRRVDTSPDEHVIAAPVAALNITRCDGALVLYVIIDPEHIVRFDKDQTAILVRNADGQISEQSGPATPWKNALELAQTASITANTDVKCDGGVGT